MQRLKIRPMCRSGTPLLFSSLRGRTDQYLYVILSREKVLRSVAHSVRQAINVLHSTYSPRRILNFGCCNDFFFLLLGSPLRGSIMPANYFADFRLSQSLFGCQRLNELPKVVLPINSLIHVYMPHLKVVTGPVVIEVEEVPFLSVSHPCRLKVGNEFVKRI